MLLLCSNFKEVSFLFFYLSDQTIYHSTDCYDLTYNCTYWAFDKKFCRTEDYAEWMSAACKESCGFCRGMHIDRIYRIAKLINCCMLEILARLSQATPKNLYHL